MNNLISFDDFTLNEKKRPSERLTKKKRFDIVKRSKRGEDIGKKGKKIEEITSKSTKKYGPKEKGEKVANDVMWKNISR